MIGRNTPGLFFNPISTVTNAIACIVLLLNSVPVHFDLGIRQLYKCSNAALKAYLTVVPKRIDVAFFAFEFIYHLAFYTYGPVARLLILNLSIVL